MKNKRTKLTALVLSALMAVSTISSVTWAADLFSDGSVETDAVEEDQIDVVSDVDEVPVLSVSSDDITATEINSVEFTYDENNNIMVILNDSLEIKEGITKGAQLDKVDNYDAIIPATCTTYECAVYSFEKGGLTVYSTGEVVGGDASAISITIDPAYKVGTPAGYIITPNSKTNNGNGHILEETFAILDSASCTETGLRLIYYHCPYCGVVLEKVSDTSFAQLTKSANPGLDDILKALGITKKADGTYDYSSLNESYGSVEDIPVVNHVPDKDNPKIVSKEYFNSSSFKDKLLELNALPYNCYRASDGSMVAYTNDDYSISLNPNITYNGHVWEVGPFTDSSKRDAYYYKVYECKYCGEPEYAELVVLRDVSGKLKEDKYFPLSNVKGLLGTNGTVLKFEDYPDGISDSLVKHPIVPVLEDCTKIGYYKVRSYETDTPGSVDEQTVTVPKGQHAWGTTEVAPKGWKLGSIDSETENTNLLPSGKSSNDKTSSNGFVVVRDGQGNVIEAKSKNCITTAKYQLYHECLNCQKREKVGDLKTALENTDRHQWGKWSNEDPNEPDIDESDNKYYNNPLDTEDEDDEYHTTVRYYHRTCALCGLRGLTVASETKEKHKLLETKIEDGPKQDPTCGFDGYYTVQLVCPCGYADKESVKQTKIPATDNHDFGTNEVEVFVKGDILVGKNGNPNVRKGETPYVVYAEVVRKCVSGPKKDGRCHPHSRHQYAANSC